MVDLKWPVSTNSEAKSLSIKCLQGALRLRENFTLIRYTWWSLWNTQGINVNWLETNLYIVILKRRYFADLIIEDPTILIMKILPSIIMYLQIETFWQFQNDKWPNHRVVTCAVAPFHTWIVLPHLSCMRLNVCYVRRFTLAPRQGRYTSRLRNT